MAKLTPKKTTKSRPGGSTVRKRSSASPKPSSKASATRKPSAAARPTAAPPARKSNARPQITVADNSPGTSSTKPAKNKAGLKSRDLAFFRELLVAKRRELVGDVHSMEQEALQSSGGSNLSNLPIHMADMGTDNYEQEFTLGLVEKDRQLLREINSALYKIRDGTYGICEGTGKPISRARLEAQPWARYSIEHARRLEKGLGPR